MKLNPDCVRDTLLAVENCQFGEYLTLPKLCERAPKYTKEELWYTCLKLNEGGYLDVILVPIMRSTMPGIKSINDLTFSGHEFLNNIRTDSNWEKIKEVSKKAGVFSLNSLWEIAKSVSATVISASLQSHL